jgi:Peptidase A4 family
MITARFLRPILLAAALPAVVVGVGVTAPAASAHAASAHAPSAVVTRRAVRHVRPLDLRRSAVRAVSTLESPAWAGYVAVGKTKTGSFRYVQATFTVPSLNCSNNADAYVSQWVGLDGFTAPTLEIAGIAEACAGGVATYGSWYDMYPAAQGTGIAVNPGDAIEVSARYNAARSVASGRYNLVLVDVTTGKRFNHWLKCGASSCTNGSAEVISDGAGSFPLADYGISNFENIGIVDHAGQKGGFSSADWKNVKAVQVNSLHAILQTPGSVFGGAAFSSYWRKAA